MDDPYKTLGAPKGASQDDIRRAYRKLAKKHHPDLNPGNAKAEDVFKAVTAGPCPGWWCSSEAAREAIGVA